MIAELDWTGLGIFITALAAAVTSIISAWRQREILKTAKDTKQIAGEGLVLVNHNMQIQLRQNRDMAARLAAETKNQFDIDMAKQAESAYQDHMSRQAIVDQGNKDNVVDIDHTKGVKKAK